MLNFQIFSVIHLMYLILSVLTHSQKTLWNILQLSYIFCPISGMILSYYKIISSILKIPSSDSKFEAFSTCGSHLSIVCLFYGTSIGVYLGSGISQSPRSVLVASVIYTVVNPILNPFMYSLRNSDIKCCFRRIQRRKIHLSFWDNLSNCTMEKLIQ
jgi:hypothetical protein